eukprot:TRINITY_DN1178_c0_g1_i1.p1 TRINITY_DN1178_c0_g1~~TRINITY_DN1178_c0_g1_i1.p1  ORF type:complete len:533 (+),score=78.39 TRINITY_DN1178_c0_g1_i1:56-1654(+)
MEQAPNADREMVRTDAIRFTSARETAEYCGRRPRRFVMKCEGDGLPVEKCKRLHFVRHGEGFHNVWRKTEFQAGREPKAKRSNISEVPSELHDPALTDLGRREAVKSQALVREQKLSPQLLVTSPQRRAIQTMMLVFEDALSRGVPCLAHELARERVLGGGGDPSIYDAHKSRDALAAEFPQIDFEQFVLPPEPGSDLQGDPFWWHQTSLFGPGTKGETPPAFVDRAWHFLSWLMSRPETEIGVATHSLFLLALFHGALELPADQRDTPQLFHTGELRSILVYEVPSPPVIPNPFASMGLALAGTGLQAHETLKDQWIEALNDCPLVAIIRGVTPRDVVPIGQALVSSGFRVIEVPLNSPDALTSIRLLKESLPDNVLLGAGTVLTPAEVEAVAQAGGRLIVSPNTDVDVVKKTKALGILSLPGAATPTEALVALRAGADGVKAFPGEHLPPKTLKAWMAILPKDTVMIPTGGICAENVKVYWEAGVRGFGVGSNVFKPGDLPETVAKKATELVVACGSLPRLPSAKRPKLR